MAGSDELDDYDDYEAPSGPKPQVTILTMVLIVLNAAAALGFVYLLGMDFQKRQEWSYQVRMAELGNSGLPLTTEDDGVSASRVTLPAYKLDSDQLKGAYQDRGGKPFPEPFEPAGPTYVPVPSPNKEGTHDYKDGNYVPNAGKTGNYSLILVDASRMPRSFIKAGDLTPAMLKDLFADGKLGPTVKTLEEEVTRLKNQLPEDLQKASAEMAAQAKKPADKRNLLGSLLLPMTTDIAKVEALAQRVQFAKDAELDDLLKDAAQRRLLFEILAPLEIAKPGDLEYRLLDRAADIAGLKVREKKDAGKDKEGKAKFDVVWVDVVPLPLDDLVHRLHRRLDGALALKFFPDVHLGKDWDEQQRDSIEQRQTIALLLVTLAHTRKNSTGVPLNGVGATYGADRAEVVLGVPEYALAVKTYAQAWQTLEERLAESIKIDRRGYASSLKDDKGLVLKDKEGKDLLFSNQSFLDKHRAEIVRIQDLKVKIDQAQENLKIAQAQSAKAEEHYKDRVKHQTAVTKQLVETRKATKKLVDELRLMHVELFQAQVELAEAAEINFRLESEIRAEEKGAKAP